MTTRTKYLCMDEALRESVVTRVYLDRKLLELKHELTVRGGLMAAAIVAILASIKYFG